MIFYDKEGCLKPELTLKLLNEYSAFNAEANGLIRLGEFPDLKCSFRNIQDILKSGDTFSHFLRP